MYKIVSQSHISIKMRGLCIMQRWHWCMWMNCFCFRDRIMKWNKFDVDSKFCFFSIHSNVQCDNFHFCGVRISLLKDHRQRKKKERMKLMKVREIIPDRSSTFFGEGKKCDSKQNSKFPKETYPYQCGWSKMHSQPRIIDCSTHVSAFV